MVKQCIPACYVQKLTLRYPSAPAPYLHQLMESKYNHINDYTDSDWPAQPSTHLAFNNISIM